MSFRLFLLLLMFVTGCAIAKTEVTIHVDDGYQPYSYLNEGRIQGLYIEIITAAFKKLDNYTVKFEPVPWNRGKHLMTKGQGFALAPAYFHAHDWPWLYPYSFPLYEETVLVVCNSKISRDKKLNWPADFADKTIGNMRGYDGWGGKAFRAMLQQNKIDYHELDNAELLIMMVASGRNHCILMEQLAYKFNLGKLVKSGQYKSEQHESLHIAAIAGKDFGYIGFSEPGVATGKYPWQKDFRKALDGTLYQMKKSGELEEIIAQFLQ